MDLELTLHSVNRQHGLKTSCEAKSHKFREKNLTINVTACDNIVSYHFYDVFMCSVFAVFLFFY